MSNTIKNIIKLRKAGNTFAEIAKRIRRSAARVYEVVRVHAPHLLGTRHCYDHLLKKIIKDIHSGLPLPQIATKHKISIYFVRKLLSNYHKSTTGSKCSNANKTAQMQPKRIVPLKLQKRRKQILKLRQKGMSYAKIAKNLQISPETVQRDLCILGVPGQQSLCKTKRNKEIINNRRAGKTMQEIAKQFGISKSRVSYLILKYNKKATNPVPTVMCRKNPSKWSGETKESIAQWNTIIQWHRNGLSRKQIAQKLNISYANLSTHITAFRKKHGKPLLECELAISRLDEIIALRESGLTIREITQRLNLSTTTIYRLLLTITKSD
jgi:transposase